MRLCKKIDVIDFDQCLRSFKALHIDLAISNGQKWQTSRNFCLSDIAVLCNNGEVGDGERSKSDKLNATNLPCFSWTPIVNGAGFIVMSDREVSVDIASVVV